MLRRGVVRRRRRCEMRRCDKPFLFLFLFHLLGGLSFFFFCGFASRASELLVFHKHGGGKAFSLSTFHFAQFTNMHGAASCLK